MFCCLGFKNLIENAGHRGLAALVVITSKGLAIEVQGRIVDADDMSKLVPSEAVPVQLRIATDIGMRFCLFCGKPVQEMIERDYETFQQLAAGHGRFKAVQPSPKPRRT